MEKVMIQRLAIRIKVKYKIIPQNVFLIVAIGRNRLIVGQRVPQSR